MRERAIMKLWFTEPIQSFLKKNPPQDEKGLVTIVTHGIDYTQKLFLHVCLRLPAKVLMEAALCQRSAREGTSGVRSQP